MNLHALKNYDQWVLLRTPRLWQLRLHIYLPLLLLLNALALAYGLWLQYRPGAWLQATEEASDLAVIFLILLAITVATSWLLACRRYNAWRSLYPMGRWDWGWEYLGIWLLSSLIWLFPTMADTGESWQKIRSMTYVQAKQASDTVEKMRLLNFFSSPENCSPQRDWTQTPQQNDTASSVSNNNIERQVRDLLKQRDVAGIAAILQDYADLVEPYGYRHPSGQNLADLAQHLITTNNTQASPEIGRCGKEWNEQYLTSIYQNRAHNKAKQPLEKADFVVRISEFSKQVFSLHDSNAIIPELSLELQWRKDGKLVVTPSQIKHYETIQRKHTSGLLSVVAILVFFAIASALFFVFLRSLSGAMLVRSLGLYIISFLIIILIRQLFDLNEIYSSMFLIVLLIVTFVIRTWLGHKRGGKVLLALALSHALMWIMPILGDIPFLSHIAMIKSSGMLGLIIALLCFALAPTVRRWYGLPMAR